MNIEYIAKEILKGFEENPQAKFSRGWFYDKFVTSDKQQGLIDRAWDFFHDAEILDEEGKVKITLAQFYRLIEDGFFDIELDAGLPTAIPHAGHVSPFLIVEPISDTEVLVSYGDKIEKKNIDLVVETGKKKKKGKERFMIEIGDTEIEVTNILDPAEIEKIAFYDMRILDDLLKNPPTTEELFSDTISYFGKYVDAPGYAFELAALFVFQSWLYPVLDRVFYVQVKAPFGGGKTTFGTSIVSICRHGFTVSSVSPASVGRGIEKVQGVPFFDEIDQQRSVNDENLMAILRAGQRRGAGEDTYERMTSEGKLMRFHVFSPKVFSVHGQIEEALSQRSFPIVLYPTKKRELAIKNLFRNKYARKLRTKFLVWFMHHGRKYLWKLMQTKFADIEGDTFISTREGREAMQVIQDLLGKNVSPRNVELSFILLLITKTLGVQLQYFDDILKQKMKEDEEYKEIGVLGVIKEIFVEWYEQLKVADNLRVAFTTSTGEIAIPYEIIYKAVNQKLRKIGLDVLSTQKFRGKLRELGIDKDEVFKRVKLPALKWDKDEGYVAGNKKRSKMAFVFTQSLCELLGVEYWSEGGGLNEFAE